MLARALTLSLAVIVGASSAPSRLRAQTLRGRVLEAGTGQPVPTALVTASWADGDSIGSTVTDSFGAFSVRTIRAGRIVLRVARLGYGPVTTRALSLGLDETISIGVELERSPVPLEPIVVDVVRGAEVRGTALDGYLERRYWLGEKLGLGTFIDRAEIEARHAFAMTDLLRTIPGVSFRRTSEGGYAPIVGRLPDCSDVQVFLDGIWVNRVPDVDIDTYAITSLIEAVEVYRGLAQVPAEFAGPRAKCGVIAIWTRRGR